MHEKKEQYRKNHWQQPSSQVALALSMAFATAAFADPAGTVDPPSTDYTGWVNANGNKYWFDSGVMARSKEIFDPGSDAWYWLDADGTMAHDKDVYQHSNGGKWVRYDANGHMIKGEQYSTKAGHVGWYVFRSDHRSHGQGRCGTCRQRRQVGVRTTGLPASWPTASSS